MHEALALTILATSFARRRNVPCREQTRSCVEKPEPYARLKQKKRQDKRAIQSFRSEHVGTFFSFLEGEVIPCLGTAYTCGEVGVSTASANLRLNEPVGTRGLLET